jgi:transcription initiation factor TFIID subunit TAF12
MEPQSSSFSGSLADHFSHPSHTLPSNYMPASSMTSSNFQQLAAAAYASQLLSQQRERQLSQQHQQQQHQQQQSQLGQESLSTLLHDVQASPAANQIANSELLASLGLMVAGTPRADLATLSPSGSGPSLFETSALPTPVVNSSSLVDVPKSPLHSPLIPRKAAHEAE